MTNRPAHRRLWTIALVISSVFTLFAAPQPAPAADIIIKNKPSCERIGGIWSAGGRCEVFITEGSEFIVQSGTQLIIEPSVQVIFYGDDNYLTLINHGTIHNNGGLFLREITPHYGTIQNNGHLEIDYMLGYGDIYNSGSIWFRVDPVGVGGILYNTGQIRIKEDFSADIINNSGTILGGFISGSVINNSSSGDIRARELYFKTINNYGSLDPDDHLSYVTLNNYGTMNLSLRSRPQESDSVLNNFNSISITGLFENPVSGTINNNGIIIYDDIPESGQLMLNRGTINNSGTIVNNGHFSNEETGVVRNYDRFDNNHTITNDGAINNNCGVVAGSGVLAGNPVVETTLCAPTVGAIVAPVDPVLVNTPVNVSVTFSDDLGDTQTAVWDWGDGSTSAGSVSQPDGVVTGNHTYTTPGLYEIDVHVTEDGGGTGHPDMPFQYLAVYDNTKGSVFVTGSGTISSPVGAYAANPSLAGTAQFQLAAKHQSGTISPKGETEFTFQAAGFTFQSVSIDWLIVVGARAMLKGEGTVYGDGNYSFQISATDGHVDGSEVDKFRIRIWDPFTHETLYDNQLGSNDEADPTSVLGGGSIVIHKK